MKTETFSIQPFLAIIQRQEGGSAIPIFYYIGSDPRNMEEGGKIFSNSRNMEGGKIFLSALFFFSTSSEVDS